ncbi:MAG: cobalt ECF transporter T component CbiQ [Kineosporiaceae bacterium]
MTGRFPGGTTPDPVPATVPGAPGNGVGPPGAALPAWLRAGTSRDSPPGFPAAPPSGFPPPGFPPPGPPSPASRRGPRGGRVGRRGPFLRRTLAAGTDVLRRMLLAEEVATRPGMLQRLDPRAKLLALLILLLAVGLLHHLPVLLVAWLFALLLGVASRVPVGFLLRRVLLTVPLFTGVLVLPATLSVVTPGPLVLELGSWRGDPVGVSTTGLLAAGFVITRVGTSVTLVALVAMTTPWNRLLAALGALGTPPAFLLIVGMGYRYLALLLGTVTDMFTARRARTVGAGRHDGSARRFLGASAGVLLGRAHLLSEEVHEAMVSRGFRGRVHTLDAPRPTAGDAVAGAVAVLTAVAVTVADRALG